LFALSLAAALLSATLPATPCETIAPPVVLVSGGSRFGSGVVWNASEGLVLTALHVVELMPEIRISLGDEPGRPARIVDRDPALDLALLRADGPIGRAVTVHGPPSPPTRGDRVRLLGYPNRRAKAALGTILDGARRFAGARYLELSVRADPGASGGPVIDALGEVVGIVDLVLTDRDSTLAIPIDAALARFPERSGLVVREGDPAVARAGRAVSESPSPRERPD
jgi:S1-C subfamily serine protease